MFYFLAPAGIPITLEDISRAIGLRSSRRSYSATFLEHIAETVDSDYAFDFNSGRTALTVILQSLSEIAGPDKDEVIIPAYTCYSVASAVVRAGMKIRLCDIEPDTLDYDYEKLQNVDPTKILAIVACGLFGISNEWELLRNMQENMRCYLVDDAAQSFGVGGDDSAPGVRGDVGFYSFGRGKNITTYAGGVAVTDSDEVACAIEEKSAGLHHPGKSEEYSALVKLTAYGMMLRPWLYWIPNSMPFLGLGETVFDPDFTMARMSDIGCRIGDYLLGRIGLLNSIRIGVADTIIKGLDSVSSLSFPGYDYAEAIPYLRLPVIMESRSARNTAIRRLRSSGIGASSMYPSTIAEIPGIEKYLCESDDCFSGGREVADRLITLPTHPYVTGTDIQRIIEIVAKIASDKSE